MNRKQVQLGIASCFSLISHLRMRDVLVFITRHFVLILQAYKMGNYLQMWKKTFFWDRKLLIMAKSFNDVVEDSPKTGLGIPVKTKKPLSGTNAPPVEPPFGFKLRGRLVPA